MRSAKILLSLTLILSISMLACAKDSENVPTPSKPPTTTTTEQQIFEIFEDINTPFESEVSEFSFGDESYTATSGNVLPYKIQGLMGVPIGEGKFPLVLITHGSHNNDDESKRFDTGFKYLVEKLSQNGYIAVSLDLSKAFIWKYGDSDGCEKSIAITSKHIENLKLANAGENPGYSTDIANKIDFSKVALIGHSRGGDIVFDIANDEISKGQPITSILSIAPTFFSPDRHWPNSSVSILVPEYDGDVVSLDGFNLYSTLIDNTGTLASITLLKKANHNYFNSNLLINDAILIRSENQLKDQLTEKDQEKFLANFAKDFLNCTIGTSKENTMYDLSKPTPNKMYGYDVKILMDTGKSTSLTDVSTMDSFTTEGAVVECTEDSWFYKNDKILIDTITFGTEKYQTKPLVAINWQNINDKVTITPNTTNFSTNSSLVINTVIDSANELNEKDKSQVFSVELKDTNGNTSKVSLPENLNSLNYIPGKISTTPIEGVEIKSWTPLSPLGEIRIPLNEFKDVDMNNIASISLIFDRTTSGSIYIESINLL